MHRLDILTNTNHAAARAHARLSGLTKLEDAFTGDARDHDSLQISDDGRRAQCYVVSLQKDAPLGF